MRRPSLACSIALCCVAVLAAQTPNPKFEVASVKRAVPGTTGGRVQFLPGGRFVAENVPLDFLLQQAYGLRDFQIVAAPELKAIVADGYGRRYDIQAKADESVSSDQLKEMVKTLLAERFSLRAHKETRDLPVYALVQARGGVKGARAADGSPGGIEMVASGWIRGGRVTTKHLVETLSRFVDRPVIDRTNLDQVLDFDLTWTPLTAGANEPTSDAGCPSSFNDMAQRRGWTRTFSCPSIFTAVQEQLGLRLEAQQAPLEALVIDAVKPPTEN